MVARRSNTANAYEGTLTTSMAPTDLTAVVDTTSGGPASPCYLVIDPGDASKREYVYFDGTFTGTTFVTSLIGNRYLTGSAAGSGITHAVGAKVRSATTSELYTDLFDYIETITKIGSAAIGDMLYVSAVTAGVATFQRLPKGTAGQRLAMNAGATAPVWSSLVLGSNFSNAGSGNAVTSTTYASHPAGDFPVPLTVTTGTSCLVIVHSEIGSTANGDGGRMSFAVSGASTAAASDANSVYLQNTSGTNTVQIGVSGHFYVTGLTAGSNTFAPRYKSILGGNCFFGNRRLTVLDA